jgi:hypothetical protein
MSPVYTPKRERGFTPSPPETGDGVAWGQRVGVRGI